MMFLKEGLFNQILKYLNKDLTKRILFRINFQRPNKSKYSPLSFIPFDTKKFR